MDKDDLFPLITESTTISRILANILAVDHIIPTLRTFFKDLKWFEPRAKIFRQLSPLKGRNKSIRQCFLAYHCGRRATNGRLLIQTTGSDYYLDEVVEHHYIEARYRQLCLFGWRNFPE